MADRCEHQVDRRKVYCPPCGPDPGDTQDAPPEAVEIYLMPVERVRALVRLLYPDAMTPHAKRIFEQVCDEYEESA